MTSSGRERGSSLIEFALMALLFCFLLMAFIELGRMLLVYNSVTNAAKAGARYAIVHGCITSSKCPPDWSGPGNTGTVEAEVTRFASSAPLDTTRLTVTVTYPSGVNTIGYPVNVRVVYAYDPLVTFFPLGVNLGGLSQGVIGF